MCLTGCITSTTTCSKSEAVSIATNEYERSGGGTGIEAEASYMNGRWYVTIWSLPKTPGGFITYEVSDKGRIIQSQPGL